MPVIKTLSEHSCYHGDMSNVYCVKVDQYSTKGQKGSFNPRLSPHINEKSLGRAWE